MENTTRRRDRHKRRRADNSSNKEETTVTKKQWLSFRERLNLIGDDGKRVWWMDFERYGDDFTKGRRNWLDLPNEAMNLIFMKLGTVWLLGVAQHVCTPWRKLSKQPILYRSVSIHGRDFDLLQTIFNNRISVGRLACAAFDRGSGHTLQFSCSSMRYFAPEHLQYIVSAAVSLKSLRLGKCGQIEIHQLASIIKKLTSLEELYLFHGRDIPKDIIVEIGHACQKLKYLRIGYFDFSDEYNAIVIAENMPALRGLHLNGNSLTVKGFQAILNGCPNLEYLRLRGTSNLSDVDAALLKKQFSRIDNIKKILTERSYKFDEYEFDIEKTGAGATQVSLQSSSLREAHYSEHHTVSLPFQDELDIQAYYG